MTFTIKMECDNAAFGEGDQQLEVSRILHDLSVDLSCCSRSTGPLFDVNGNKIGKWEFTA